MDIFKTKLLKRIAIGKTVGLIFGGLGFFLLPYFLNNSDLYLRFGIWFWYVSLGAFVGVFGVLNYHPLCNIPMPFWFRGIILGGWMNFVLVLFIHDKFVTLLQGSMFDGMSPFWLVVEGMIFGIIAEFFATKYAGEGKELVEKIK